jgi:hypothetical protein
MTLVLLSVVALTDLQHGFTTSKKVFINSTLFLLREGMSGDYPPVLK